MKKIENGFYFGRNLIWMNDWNSIIKYGFEYSSVNNKNLGEIYLIKDEHPYSKVFCLCPGKYSKEEFMKNWNRL